MNSFELKQIGAVRKDYAGAYIVLEPQYAEGLREMKGFSHINVLWWFDGCDSPSARSVLLVGKPYKSAPQTIGVFATRSPSRPNPIAVTACEVAEIDADRGRIRLTYIDADDGSPVIDIKPYTPSLDRVEAPRVPEWCAEWPRSLEESGSFDWDSVFDFEGADDA